MRARCGRLGRWGTAALLLAALPGWALDGKVVRVSDGDSVWIKPAGGGRSLRVRVQGIDAPEICQAGGPQARLAMEALVLNRQVQLSEQGHDDYGRVLGRLRLPQTGDVGARMVSQGQAWSYRYRGDPGPYAVQEKQAAAAHLGLHSQAGAMLPRDFRLSHGPCK